MKFVNLDTSPLFHGEKSRLNNAVVTANDLGLEIITPVLVDSEDTGFLVESDPKVDFLLWSDLINLSEDRGVVIIYSEYDNKLEWKYEQVITNTLASRLFPFKYKQDKLVLGYLLTPYKSCPLEEVTLVLRDDGCIDLSSFNFDAEVAYLDTNRFASYPYFDSIAITGPSNAAAGSTVELTVTPPFDVPNIYVQSTCGFLNRSRFKGTQKVLLNTDGLSAGEDVKVKVGYQFWPGDAEIIITLV